MRKTILRNKIFRPLQPPEAYTRQAISSAFPGGEWVEEPDGAGRAGLPQGATPGLPPAREGAAEESAGEMISPGDKPDSRVPPCPSITIIGDTKDLDALMELLEEHAPDEVILGRLPSGRGAESKIAAHLRELGTTVIEVETTEDVFGAKASDVNVEAVLTHDIHSPLLILGNGTRAKAARSWLGRANWPREVITL